MLIKVVSILVPLGLACTFAGASAQDAADLSELIDCSKLKGENVIDTQQLQAECYQVQQGWLQERKKALDAKKDYLETVNQLKKTEERDKPVPEVERPKAEVALVSVQTPIWPVFLYGSDKEGVPSATLQYLADGATQKVVVGDELHNGGIVSRIFDKRLEVLWNGQTYTIRGSN